jgi:Domain of unknown function (DUF5060)/Protein of unknown function (DUF4038)/Putative collagen-binding domain of a collagenase
MKAVAALLLALVAVAHPQRAAAGPTSAPQWSVAELTLTAAGRYANPYVETEVSVTFNGPDGIVKTVPGFWDGGSTWRIRFTPTREGRWTWSTRSPDPGLDGKSGSIRCTAPAPGQHGFLRRDVRHPSTFVWDDGTRFFMWGQTYYEIVRHARADPGWRRAIDEVKALGLTKVRMLLYPWPAQPAQNRYPDSQPFRGSRRAPDHDTLDLRHWHALDDVIRYLERQGLVADLVLVADNARTFGTEAQDHRYARYALARFAAFPNVIWTLSNEWNYTRKPRSYFDTLGSIIRDEDPWMVEGQYLRPLSTHQQTRIDFQFFDARWPVHAIIQYGVRNGRYVNGDEWGNAGIVANAGHGMPVVNDEYGYAGESSAAVTFTPTQHRQAIWGIATAGGFGSVGSVRPVRNGNVPMLSADWKPEPEYEDLKRLIGFFTSREIPYWTMSSQNGLITSGDRVYVLAAPGSEYVIYSATGGTFAIELAPGTYTATRFDPRTGTDTALGAVPGGGSRALSVPEGADWVVHLKAEADVGASPRAPRSDDRRHDDALTLANVLLERPIVSATGSVAVDASSPAAVCALAGNQPAFDSLRRRGRLAAQSIPSPPPARLR